MKRTIDFTVRCTDPERKGERAKYKIAAEWIGGGFTELKTFGFADDECLARVFQRARERAQKILFSEGEALGEMRVYLLDTGRHDYELTRAPDIEAKLLAALENPK